MVQVILTSVTFHFYGIKNNLPIITMEGNINGEIAIQTDQIINVNPEICIVDTINESYIVPEDCIKTLYLIKQMV